MWRVYNSTMKIRHLKRADATRTAHMIFKSLTKLNNQDYPKHVIVALVKRYEAEALWKSHRLSDIYVALCGGRVLGTASLQGSGIYSVFVDPNFTRRSVGTTLMNQLEHAALRRGRQHITLTSSVTAVGFYLACGYNIIRKLESLRTGCLFEMQKVL